MHWVEPWMDLASAFGSAGMQRGRQVKHTAVSRKLTQTPRRSCGDRPIILLEGVGVLL